MTRICRKSLYHEETLYHEEESLYREEESQNTDTYSNRSLPPQTISNIQALYMGVKFYKYKNEQYFD